MRISERNKRQPLFHNTQIQSLLYRTLNLKEEGDVMMLVSLVPRTLDTQLQTLAILDKVSSVDNG